MSEHWASQEIRRQLESMTGAQIRSRDDVRRQIAAHHETNHQGRQRKHKSLHLAKNAAWLFMLTFAFLQYYTLEVLNEIASMHSITFAHESPAATLSIVLQLIPAGLFS